MRIALTGNIASGKSEVLKILKENGYNIIDTDDISHELLTVKNLPLFDVFKDFDVFENGEFSREKLGKLVFSNIDLRKKLESIIHPQIEQEIKRFFKKYSNEEYVFVAIPLLFEAKMEKLFDKIVLIYTNDEIRLQRLINRNNYDKEYALTRINSQMSQDEKIGLCNYVIKNNGTTKELQNNVLKIIKQV